MATLRGSSRSGYGDTHVAVSGYDEDENEDESSEKYGSLLADDSRKRRNRGIGKAIRNFLYVRLRYDPTIAIIILMILAAIGLVYCLTLIVPLGPATVALDDPAVTKLEGFNGRDGLKEPVRPVELTAEDLPNAANGDTRFTFNGQVYSVSHQGDIYTAKEDLVQPILLEDGSYNPANARTIRFRPGRVILLPEVITEDEEALLMHQGERQFSEHPKWTSGAAGGPGQLRLASFPNATDVQERVMRRIQHIVGVPPAFVQPWVYRVDSTNSTDTSNQSKEGAAKAKKNEAGDKFTTAEMMHQDFWSTHAPDLDYGRTISGILYLESGFNGGELSGGGTIFLQDEDMFLFDLLLQNNATQLPEYEDVYNMFSEFTFGIDMNNLDRGTEDMTHQTLGERLFQLRRDAIKKASMLYTKVKFLCSISNSEKTQTAGWANYLDDFVNLKGMFKIKQQPRTLVVFDNVFTKHVFRTDDAPFALRSSFHGMCQELGIRKSYHFWYQNSPKSALKMRELYYSGTVPVE